MPGHEEACAAILTGYREGLEAGGKPFVLEEENKWLREAATGELRDPVHFWGKMNALPPCAEKFPRARARRWRNLLPAPGLVYRVAHRVAGLGSLGRERYVALADWEGGRVAREAKALLAFRMRLGEGRQRLEEDLLREIITTAARAPDPFVHLRGRWIVRRLAPHCSRIEMAAIPKKRRGAPAPLHGL